MWYSFHAFGPFRNLTWHHAAAPGAKVFVYMTYRNVFYMWYSFHTFEPFRNLTWHRTAAPKRYQFQRSRHNHFQIRRSLLKWSLPDQSLAASPTFSNATRQVPAKNLSEKSIPEKNSQGANALLANDPPGNGISRLKLFWSKCPSTGTEKKFVINRKKEKRMWGGWCKFLSFNKILRQTP